MDGNRVYHSDGESMRMMHSGTHCLTVCTIYSLTHILTEYLRVTSREADRGHLIKHCDVASSSHQSLHIMHVSVYEASCIPL